MRILASRDGLALMFTLMVRSGGLCPKCFQGTRVTSERWARCRECGERVERRDMDEVAAELREEMTS